MNVGPFFIITTGLAMSLLPSSFWGYFDSRIKIKSRTNSIVTLTPFKFSSLTSVALLFLILFMVRANVKHWYVQGHLSNTLQSVPGMGFLCYKFQPSSAVLQSVVNQPWGFFKLDKQDEFGTYAFVGTTLDGRVVDLTSNELTTLNNEKLAWSLANTPSNLNDAMYVYMINLRHYKDEAVPSTVFQKTLQNRLDHWQAANKQLRLTGATLYFLSKKVDSTSLKNSIYTTGLETVVDLNLTP
jgi:hypothetical protein